MSDYILEMNHITKDFSGVKALDDVNLKVKRGEIHALCGENGAGKSTLMKVISGGTTPDSGEFEYAGKTFKKITPAQSQENGLQIKSSIN